MKKKTTLLATENELLVDLTFNPIPASLLTEFAEKIAKPSAGEAEKDVFFKLGLPCPLPSEREIADAKPAWMAKSRRREHPWLRFSRA
jgi:hypothetical protein